MRVEQFLLFGSFPNIDLCHISVFGKWSGKDILQSLNFGNFWGLVPGSGKIGGFACNKFSGEYMLF